MTFGEKLRKLMKTRGIKAITLAQRMGVSCAYISQLITGIRRPGRETLLKLSKSLEVPLDTLLMLDSDTSEKILISRKVPVLDETKIDAWVESIDLDYPSLVANSFEYATTDDPNAFYITPKGLLSCCGLETCDLLLIEPNKEMRNGDTALVHLPEGFSIRKIVMKDNMMILMDEKQEPIISAKDNVNEGLKFFRISVCIKKL
ncbi:MAG: helix-turn-helix transcriptional regulator [Nitrospira sp.]|nr:helix-turn-helix transcriptional regulator [Nitrospira sp.]